MKNVRRESKRRQCRVRHTWRQAHNPETLVCIKCGDTHVQLTLPFTTLVKP